MLLRTANVIKNRNRKAEKLKKLKKPLKNQRYRNTKNQNKEGQKPSFIKRLGRKCRLK